MRYFRNFAVLFILFFLFIKAYPVYADSYFSLSGCSDDPKSTCLSAGDGVNTVIPLPLTAQIVANIAAKLHLDRVTAILGSLRPDGNYNTGTEKLNSFATQIQTASEILNPAQLQAIEKHDTTQKPSSMTSRLCIYDPQTGALIGNGIVSNHTVITGDVQYLQPGVESSRRLSSFTTNFTQESQDYRLPNVTIYNNTALPCDAKITGQKLDQIPKTYQSDNVYGSDSSNGIISFFMQPIEYLMNLFTKSGTSMSHITGTGQTTFAGHLSALTAGCATSADLNSVAYATNEQKQKLCAAGGFVNSMYRPNDNNPAFNANDANGNDPSQKWQETVIGSNPQAANSNSFAARIENAGVYTRCTLAESDYQDKAVPGDPEACKQNWVGAGPTPDPSSTPIFIPGIQGTPVAASSASCGSCTSANDICEAENIAASPPTASLTCSYSVGSIEGPPSLGTTMKQAGDYFGVPPQILAGIQYIETGEALPLSQSYKHTDEEIRSFSEPGNYDPHYCETNQCGAVGPVQLSIKACDYSQCENARDNYKEWCLWRSGANDIRTDPAYKPNPNNYLDAYAALSKLLKAGSGIAGCGPWTEEAVKQVVCYYYGGKTECQNPQPKQWLYGIGQLWLPNTIDSYAKVAKNALTYSEFVWVYYLTHR